VKGLQQAAAGKSVRQNFRQYLGSNWPASGRQSVNDHRNVKKRASSDDTFHWMLLGLLECAFDASSAVEDVVGQLVG
jgi:hypothetical protein